MQRKFPFRFRILTTVLIIAAGVLSAGMFVYNFYALLQGFLLTNKGLLIAYTAVSGVLFAAVVIILCLSQYRIKNKAIVVRIGFVPVLSIPFAAIAKFVISAKNEEFFIIYTRDNKLKTHMICLSASDAAQVMDAVSEIYPDIIREKI